MSSVMISYRNLVVVFFLFCIVALPACKQLDTFEFNQAIPNHAWQSNTKLKGSFNIEDTAALYNLSIVLRHTDAYNFNNIWLNVGLQFPNDTMQLKKVNLALGDDANGWEGIGIDDIWELRKKLNTQPIHFNKKGIYHFEFSHIMREDPLQQIVSVGLRVDKIPE